MFAPPTVQYKDLQWEAVGPEPDPAIVLRSFLAFNNTRFGLVAFRVPMAFTAGWSRRSNWEDKNASPISLLWDMNSFRTFVLDIEHKFEGQYEVPAPQLDRFQADLFGRWQAISDIIGWSPAKCRCGLIKGVPYVITGYPVGPAQGDEQSASMVAVQERAFAPKGKNERQYCMLIEGQPTFFEGRDVRVLGIGDRQIVRPINMGDTAWLSKHNLTGLLYPYLETDSKVPVRFEDDPEDAAGQIKRLLHVEGILCPAELIEFYFDLDVMSILLEEIEPDTTTFFIDRPGHAHLGAAPAAMLANICKASWDGHLELEGQRLTLTLTTEEVRDLIRANGMPDADIVDAMAFVFKDIFPLTIRGIAHCTAEDKQFYYQAEVIDTLTTTQHSVKIYLTNQFVNLCLFFAPEQFASLSSKASSFQLPYSPEGYGKLAEGAELLVRTKKLV